MKIKFSMLFVFLAVFQTFTANSIETEENEEETENEDYSTQVNEDHHENYEGVVDKFFEGMTQQTIADHIKDIVRGISDKAVEECDIDGDNYLNEIEAETYIRTKMGYSLKMSAAYVVDHYDEDKDGKLSKDEVWKIVEEKNPTLFTILPEVLEKNMLLMHGIQEGNIYGDHSENEAMNNPFIDFQNDEL